MLFECVGKILGKAIYEGILMDVPFASFLLNMMCGRRYMTMYSSLDELSSLDPALDKSLRFIKVWVLCTAEQTQYQAITNPNRDAS